MSTALSQLQLTASLPKSVAMLKPAEDKPRRFNRSSSIETIKRINTYICSPQSYILPAILTTWLKTGQNGLQQSTEKTIFMFRSVFFGSFLFKFLLIGAKSASLAGQQASKLDFQKVVLQIVANLHEQLVRALETVFVIALVFKMAVIVMTVQVCLCVFYLSQSVVPLGLGFLLLSGAYIVSLGYRLNKFYLMKRDVKSKNVKSIDINKVE